MLFHVALAASTVLEPFPSGRQIVLPVLDLDKKTHVLHTVAKSANELRFSLSAIVSATANLSGKPMHAGNTICKKAGGGWCRGGGNRKFKYQECRGTQWVTVCPWLTCPGGFRTGRT